MTLWRFSVAFVLIWALGFAASYTLHGYLHLLLVAAGGIAVTQIFLERRRVNDDSR